MESGQPHVVVIGAGVIGCAVAWELARRGQRVTIIERDAPGSGASYAAAGMLSPIAEAGMPGPFLELGLASLELFPTMVGELRRLTGIDPGYIESGKLRVALDDEGVARLQRDLAWQSSLGHRVEWLDGDAARRVEPALTAAARGAARVALDHQVDTRAFARALWHAATAAGARVVRTAPVVALRTDRAAGTHASEAVSGVVLAGGEIVEADVVVLAAGSWSGLIDGLPRKVPVFPVPGQIVALTAVPRIIRHLVMTDRCYLVPRADGRILVGATAEPSRYKAEPTAEGVAKLLAAAIEAVPALAGAPFADTWAGLRPATPDELPILGEDPDVAGLYYATGHFRNGILLTPITASLIGDLVTGRPPALSVEPFRPDRFEAAASSAGIVGTG